jgi:hypothetical protein
VFAQIYRLDEAPMTITTVRRQDYALDHDAIRGSIGLARTSV